MAVPEAVRVETQGAQGLKAGQTTTLLAVAAEALLA
jgi:fructose-specific phosphotransferase system component IIB